MTACHFAQDYGIKTNCVVSFCMDILFHSFLQKGSKDPVLSVPVDGPKVTAALWGPLDQYIITGHENGDLCQWDTKVRE